MTTTAKKDRDLTILEYFERLQIEYFICEIRRKIYPSPVDKKHYKRVMGLKQEKIEDIAHRNQLDSIFTSEAVRKEYQDKVYPTQGLPKFTMDEKDTHFYYLEDTDVRINEGEKVLFGKIVRADHSTNIILIRVKSTGKERPFPAKDVTRIL